MLNQLALVGIVKNDVELRHGSDNEPYVVLSIVTKITAVDEIQFSEIDYIVRGQNAIKIVKHDKVKGGTLAYLRGSVIQNNNGLEIIPCELAFLGSMLSNQLS
ncbi:hypothetical protein [Breznakia pachnodae]|uniref:Single-stranded DNA-binding protein n=1 Tax=Breznakia pachnodae TaxID=265178 RepID=A0ABU0E8N1_9FIRM|nr:hypothetical protein [Breznakia pachnodae]MDQ0363257.1 single-stranded DNA-binding protein [Breznakia pachnodae]